MPWSKGVVLLGGGFNGKGGWTKACDDGAELVISPSCGQKVRDFLTEKMPLCLKNRGGALWLRKVKD